MFGLILAIVALVLAFLDLVLWYTTPYARHLLLQIAMIVLCVAVLIGVPGFLH